MKNPDPIHVQETLSGLEYPATKRQVVVHAKKAGADNATINAIESLPDQTYNSPADISKHIDYK